MIRGEDAMPAVGLFRGRGHIVIRLNGEAVERIGDEPRLVPAAEVYVGPEAARILGAMDLVYDSGEPLTLELHDPEGRLAILPRWQRGRVIGVACVFRPAPPFQGQTLLPRPLALHQDSGEPVAAG